MFGRRNNPYEGQSNVGPGLGGVLGRLGAPLIIGLVIFGFSYIKYCSTKSYNEYLGIEQHVSLTPDQEIAIGLQSTPAMIQEYGGLDGDQRAQSLVKQVGQKLVQQSVAAQSPYQFDFHLLADPQTVNAFALPGGQVFITRALMARLQNEDQLAGVLGHEIGHVLARHSGERMEKDGLLKGFSTAIGVALGDYGAAQMAQQAAALIGLKYGRDQELQSDDLGIRFMMDASYNPEEMIGVMEILKQASGGARQDEFTSTHPDPENRKEKIIESIAKYKSQGTGK
ncbi:MAG TPA: M48 family metallopeptidase [Saprospiraceae bacterium]|nr:M48 family metallopeptidase [Saprospiraceae bacterium]